MMSESERLLKIGLALITADIEDAVRMGFKANNIVLKDPGIKSQSMENSIVLNSVLAAVRKAIYMQADIVNQNPKEIGYYNVNQFMRDVCENIGDYILGEYDIHLSFEENPAFNENFGFDAHLLEKTICDVVHTLMTGVRGSRKITFYIKDTIRYFEIGARTNFPAVKRERSLAEAELMYPDVSGVLEGESYASVAAKQMGGYAKSKYLKNMTRIEIGVPKIKEISPKRMHEGETMICSGERVMVHKVCSEKMLRLLLSTTEYLLDN